MNNWLLTTGFTVGAADIGPDAILESRIEENYEESLKVFYRVLSNYRDSKIIEDKSLHQRGKRIQESFEFNVNENLNSRLTKAQDEVKKHVSPYLNN